MKYVRPPLPFPGNKSRIRKELIPLIDKEFPDDAIYVDLFGGSFYLSYLVKSLKPNSRVICNDFDNYAKRLEAIPQTNRIIENIAKIVDLSPKNHNTKMSDEDSMKVKEFLYNIEGDVDWISLGSKFTYSGSFISNQDDFMRSYLYYRKWNPFPDFEEYLKGIEIVRDDWKIIYDQWKDDPNVIFLADPPYQYTVAYTFNYSRIDHENLLKNILSRNKFMYFTCPKSPILNKLTDPPDYKIYEFTKSSINSNTRKRGNKDILLYK